MGCCSKFKYLFTSPIGICRIALRAFPTSPPHAELLLGRFTLLHSLQHPRTRRCYCNKTTGKKDVIVLISYHPERRARSTSAIQSRAPSDHVVFHRFGRAVVPSIEPAFVAEFQSLVRAAQLADTSALGRCDASRPQKLPVSTGITTNLDQRLTNTGWNGLEHLQQ